MTEPDYQFDLPVVASGDVSAPRPSAGNFEVALPESTATQELRFIVKGMHCAGCVHTVEKSLHAIPEVEFAEVNLATNEARIQYHQEPPPVEMLEQAIASCGFSYSSLNGGSVKTKESQAEAKAETRDLITRILIAAPFAIIVAVLSMMKIAWPGMNWLLLACSLPVIYWAGMPFYSSTFNSLRYRRLDMDSLIVLGSSTAFFTSLFSTVVPQFWSGEPPIFYEAATMILVIVLIGRLLEQRAKRKTTQAIDGLLSLQVKLAHLLEDGNLRDVPIESLQIGNKLVVKPGERVPVDGVVLEGASYVDESMISGESVPVLKEPGHALVGGTLNQRGRLIFQAERVGSETLLQGIVNLVRDAQGSKAPITRFADRISGYFVPAVLIISSLTLLGWLWFDTSAESLQHAIFAAVSVLVVTCPCALGLATPTAVSVAMGRSAEEGVLFRDGATLERAYKIDAVLLDKTGTITAGRPTLTEIHLLADITETELLQLAASLEQASQHPIAHAILTATEEREIELVAVEEFESADGLGIRGEINGKPIYVGNSQYLQQSGNDQIAHESVQQVIHRMAATGKTVVLVAREQELLGLLGVSDPVLPNAATAIHELKEMGIDVWMLSGDRRETAELVGQQVGIPVERIIAETLPAQKADQVTRLQQTGLMVAMVGDGINDAPALAMAEVGMAVGRGNEIALEAGNVTLVREGLTGVVTALQLSKRTMRTIRQNLFFAFVYNLVGVPFAAGLFYPLLLPPMFAAAAMSLSSISVVSNSLRLRRFRSTISVTQQSK